MKGGRVGQQTEGSGCLLVFRFGSTKGGTQGIDAAVKFPVALLAMYYLRTQLLDFYLKGIAIIFVQFRVNLIETGCQIIRIGRRGLCMAERGDEEGGQEEEKRFHDGADIIGNYTDHGNSAGVGR